MRRAKHKPASVLDQRGRLPNSNFALGGYDTLRQALRIERVVEIFCLPNPILTPLASAHNIFHWRFLVPFRAIATPQRRGNRPASASIVMYADRE